MRYLKITLLLLTVFTVSCSKDEVNPSLCPDGYCDGTLSVFFPKDANGYYHVDLDFGGTYLPRFDIYVEADDVDPFYYYNDMGVVQAAFSSDSFWVMPTGVTVELVQSTTLYLNDSSQNNEYIPSLVGRKWAKRTIGPIPSQFIGDTITIQGEIYWDGGSKSNSQLFEEKFIIE